MQKRFSLFLLLLALGGCTIYRIDVQQGNVVSKEKLAQVEVGMSRDQVRFILGTPLVQDPFHHDRWDYIYRLTPGDSSIENEHYRVTLHFVATRLSRIEKHGKLPPTDHPKRREVLP